MENKKYNTLVLSGGGSKGIPMIGALQYLYDHDIIQEFDSFYGSSVGGILCVLIILGYTPRQIIIRLIQKNHLMDLPKYFQWGLGQRIQIRVYYDDIGQTQKRAM